MHGKHKNADICDDYRCCQAWISKEDRLAKWSQNEAEANWNKITEAVDATQGKIITYNGSPIDAFFHSNSGGTTETANNVWGGDNFPYLKSVQTSGEDGYTQYSSGVELTKDEFINTYNTFLQSFDFAGISKEKDLQGKRSFGTDKYIGTYKAEYDNITSEEAIFGGTALNRKNGDHIRLKIKVEKQSGNINVIAKLGYNEKTLIDDTGEYEDNIYIEGVSYYLTIKLDDFKGNIDIISE